MSNTAILKPLAMTATPAVSSGTGAANLLTDDPKEIWIAGASGNATITLDLGSAQTIDTAFLGFSNLVAGNTVIAATSNASDMSGASTLESRVIPDSLDITHMVFTGSSRSARYLRFTITTSVTPQVGIARAGAKFQPTYNREWGSGRSVIDTGAKEALLGGGFGIGEGARKAAFRWTFGDLSDAEVESLYDIAADRGETRPLIVAEDPDNTAGIGRRIHYGLFDRLEFYERANPSQNRWSLSVQGWGAAPKTGSVLDLGLLISSGTNTSVATNPGNDGYRVTKTAGGSAYNADFTSVALTGDFTLRIDFVSGQFAMAGVSLTPSADATLAGIEYGVEYYSSTDTLYVYANGSIDGEPSVVGASPKRAWIKRTGNSFSIRYGGATYAAATEFTGYPATEALGTLYLDGSIYSQGAVMDLRLTAP